VIDTHSAEQLKNAVGSFDFIISTVTADLNWSAYLDALDHKGRLHVVGAVQMPFLCRLSQFLPAKSR
jgi:uncharacterized zinc-type alcohol dehydrogenase-like protein